MKCESPAYSYIQNSLQQCLVHFYYFLFGEAAHNFGVIFVKWPVVVRSHCALRKTSTGSSAGLSVILDDPPNPPHVMSSGVWLLAGGLVMDDISSSRSKSLLQPGTGSGSACSS